MKFPRFHRAAPEPGPPPEDPAGAGSEPWQVPSALDAARGPSPLGLASSPDENLQGLGQQLTELADRIVGLSSSVAGLEKSHTSTDDRMSHLNERFLQLVSLLERRPSENPFVQRTEVAPPPPAPAAAPASIPARGPVPVAFAAVEEFGGGVPPVPWEPAPLALGETRALEPVALVARSAGPEPLPRSPERVVRFLRESRAEHAPVAAVAKPPLPRPGPSPGPAASAPVGDVAHSVLLLEWADMLLASVDREALGYLLDWYHQLGWIDQPLKDAVLAYCRGLLARADDRAASEGHAGTSGSEPRGDVDWRQDLALHLSSLAFASRLRGLEGGPGRLDEAIRQAVALRAR